MKQEYIDLVENTWGESEEFAYALYHMLGGNEELFKKVVTEDLTFNRYTCDVWSWRELAETIIHDDAFGEKEYNDYILSLQALSNKDDEYVKQYLIEQNWAIDTENDIAIGFDKQVKVVNHEVAIILE